jgi:Kef-type K+ transport system membrane component KefB
MSLLQLIKVVITDLVVFMSAARIFGIAFRKFGLPQVCGEIAAGIPLRPSIFGALFPGAAHYIFNPAFSQVFTALSQLGLVLLMFVIGLDF